MPILHDLTIPVGADTPRYPGDRAPQLVQEKHLRRGDGYTATRATMSVHAGTHLDAPAHFLPDGRTVDQLDLDSLFVPARVVQIPDHVTLVEEEHLQGISLQSGEALLLRTSNTTRGLLGTPAFDPSYVALAPSAGHWLVKRGAVLAGIDYLSIEPPDDQDFPVHKILLGGGVGVLENVDLSGVTPGRYTLCCLPLRLQGAEASPVRAVLMPAALSEVSDAIREEERI